MTPTLFFAIPGDPETRTGGYAYDRRMIAELRKLGWRVEPVPLPSAFPFPRAEDLAQTQAIVARLPDNALVLVDGLAFGAMADIAEKQAGRLRLVALVHHPLAMESGLAADCAERLRAGERRALAAARAIVVTSAATARDLEQGYGVPRDRLIVAPPGTDKGPLSKGDGGPPLIVSIGTLSRRKGHDVLIAALSRLKDLEWRCRIIGSAERDPDMAEALRRQVSAEALDQWITLNGESADARAELATADLFVLASRHEGYGMAYAEAMSQGVPVVGCHVGAVPDLVPETAGRLVPPERPDALADAMRDLIADPALRRSYAEGARQAGEALPSWAASARILARRLESVGR